MRKFTLAVASLLLLNIGSADAVTIGYSKETINRNIFRLGSSTTQGQAIRLSKAKLQALKGKTIDFVEIAVGSKNTTDNKLNTFISTSLDGTPLVEGTLKVSRAYSKAKWTLSTPYTITGDEECLYIGYTAEIPSTYNMLLSDGSYDISGCNFAYKDGEWVDTYGMGKGSAYIFVNVDGAADYTDAIMGRNNFDGYFKAGNDYDFSARFLNAGTTTITAFDAIVTVGGKTTTQHFDGLAIKPKEGYSFKLSGLNSNNEGNQDVNVELANVNGKGVEVDPSDNSSSGSLFFYPHDMERSLLVESFTGQDCTQCPSGHVTIDGALEAYQNVSEDSIIELTHHAGYYPDMFTMEEDDFSRFFYSNPGSTFAPAVMVNRNADSSVGMAPVVNVDYGDIITLLSHAASAKPYVSLNLETALDKSTRELIVKLQVKPHTDMPSDKVLFNVYLVQDGIKAYQANGGTNYTHSRVSRGTVTGNNWGISCELEDGKTMTWTKTITIPDSIHSSYWIDDYIDNDGMYSGKYNPSQTNIKAVLENMSVVAYVGEYDADDNTKNIIFNSCEAKLGESHMQKGFGTSTDVESVEQQPATEPAVRVADGRISVSGDCERVDVYSIAGGKVNVDSRLANGVYIVKLLSNGKLTTKKVLVK